MVSYRKSKKYRKIFSIPTRSSSVHAFIHMTVGIAGKTRNIPSVKPRKSYVIEIFLLIRDIYGEVIMRFYGYVQILVPSH